MNKQSVLIALTALALPTALCAQSYSFTSIGQTYNQNFNTFAGTEASLPSFWSHEGTGTDPIFRGLVTHSPSNVTGDYTGVMALTSGAGNSIAWREGTGAANLSDFRLLFAFTNNTSQPITGFEFTYDLESWFRGARINELRFKYDTVLDDPDRSTFQTDILTRYDDGGTQTVNPGLASSSGTPLDGNSVRTQVTGFLNLQTYLIDESITDPLDPLFGQTFGALQPGESAYFRWQISNVTGDSGNRSVLGINNLSVTAVPEPSTYAAIFGILTLAGVALRRRIHTNRSS